MLLEGDSLILGDMRSTSTKARLVVVGLGFFLHLLVFFIFLSSGLLVPIPVVGLLLAIWLALLVFAVRWRKQPWRVLAIPGIAMLLWLVIVQGGSWVFGWTA